MVYTYWTEKKSYRKIKISNLPNDKLPSHFNDLISNKKRSKKGEKRVFVCSINLSSFIAHCDIIRSNRIEFKVGRLHKQKTNCHWYGLLRSKDSFTRHCIFVSPQVSKVHFVTLSNSALDRSQIKWTILAC